ncbi:MAG: hypothetical protein AAFR90_07585 [Pseudomonadota bacterium]
MARFIAAIIVIIFLAFLLAWQHHRWSMVKYCHEAGGVWDGSVSRCRLVPTRPLIHNIELRFIKNLK